jgi:hypothetical protein
MSEKMIFETMDMLDIEDSVQSLSRRGFACIGQNLSEAVRSGHSREGGNP